MSSSEGKSSTSFPGRRANPRRRPETIQGSLDLGSSAQSSGLTSLKSWLAKAPQHRHHSVVLADYWQWDAAGGRRRRSVALVFALLAQLRPPSFDFLFFFFPFQSYPSLNPFGTVSLTAMAIPFPPFQCKPWLLCLQHGWELEETNE